MKIRTQHFLTIGMAAFLMVACGSNNTSTNSRQDAVASAVTNKTDVQNADIIWTGYKITGSSHTGTVSLHDSKLEFSENKLTGGSFTVDMKSLTNTDMEGDYNQKLIGHLNSPDFFDVINYPTGQFTITQVKSGRMENEYKVTGDLTIKGITISKTFDAKVQVNNNEAVVSANFNIDRTKFGIKYNSGSFFENLGDNVIKDEFNLDVRLTSDLSTTSKN